MTEPRWLGRVLAYDGDVGVLKAQIHGGGSAVDLDYNGPAMAPGDVFVHSESDGYVRTDGALWEAVTVVGVVRHVDEHRTVVDLPGGLVATPTAEIPFDVRTGWTVIFNEFGGIVEVVAKYPVERHGLAEGPLDVSSFRADADELKDTFDDFAGDEILKRRARRLVRILLRGQEELAAVGVRPIRGVLFTGPPGTGKTFLARILARETRAPFFRVSGPELVSKWVGSSESALRELFREAEAAAPSIVFMDELDSIAPRRDGETHEASKRLVGQLLTLMDGFHESNVVVVGATNRPQDLDPALRRPGRFDWTLHFSLPDRQARQEILSSKLARIASRHSMPVRALAARTEGWSGADIEALLTEAALMALDDERTQIRTSDLWAAHGRISMDRERATS